MGPVRNLLPLAVMIVAYCFLLNFVMGRLPYAWLPHPWMEAFASRRSGVATWFAFLNFLGALVSAAPIAVVLCWIAPLRVARNAVLCGGITAAVVLISIVAFEQGAPKVSAALTVMIWRDTIVEVLAVALAPVALGVLIRRLRVGVIPSASGSG